MNTMKKCDDCIKANVCKFKEEYQQDIEGINAKRLCAVTTVHITCKEFVAKPSIREWGNE